MTERLIKVVELVGGLRLEFIDRGNRYFGDYHRILIDVEVRLEGDKGELHLRHQRPLKKMGVSGQALQEEKTALIESFLATTGPYMERAGFASALKESLCRPGQKIWQRIN